tara:strand:- start:2813 stop:3937 length:1125 start_codon:yes stop_codon:yes gene_type:complete
LKNSIKKILITHSSNDKYGASKVLISIIDIFINNGFEVHLMLPNNGPLNNNETIKKTKLSIINLGVFRKRYFTFFGLINRFYLIIKSSLFIRKYLKKNQIDLVYTNTSTLISPSIAAKIYGIPSIYHIHEIPSSSYIYLRFMTTFLNNFSKKIICVSKSVNEFWIINGLKKSKVKIIHNGFKIKNSKSKILDNDKIVFTSVSRIIPYKGHSLLIRIFEILFEKNKNIYLQIVGDTLPEYQKYLSDIKLKVKEKGLESKISFLGFQNDVIPLLNNSDFFIHLPISPDPFPTVIFEAINTKTPVITNDLGGAIEILNNGKNGLFINNDSIEDAINKILDYINNQQLQKENIENAFDYVCENFSYEKFQRNILDAIK